jgi:Pheromone A receptor
VSTLLLFRENLSRSFSGLNMYHIWTRGQEIKSILGSLTGVPGYNHYTRLFILSAINIVVIVPFNIWYFAMWLQTSIGLWPGWKGTHSTWAQINITTTPELTSVPQHFYQIKIPRWMNVVSGLIFFVFFSVTVKARKHYASAWQYISKIFGLQMGFSSGCMLGFVLFRLISCDNCT